MNFTKALERSQQDFLDVVWPAIRDVCGGGEIIPVESVSEAEFANALDVLSGIDAWQRLPDEVAGEALRGIAIRTQWGQRAWDTFTVRCSRVSGMATEYQKRTAALTGRGYLTPYLTVQSYITDGGRLLSVGVARTEDVIAAVDRRRCRTNPADGSQFYWVRFRDVPGCRVLPETQPSLLSGATA